MAAENREKSISLTLSYEGGYRNHPADPGGPTNWGITIADARRYWKPDATAEDVKAMPKSVAIGIYQRRYWAPVKADNLPAGVDFATFDFGVNSGIFRGAKALQRAVKVAADGVVGSVTLAAAAAVDPVTTVKAICADRLAFLQGLKTWNVFKGGWGRRVADVEANGVKMALAAKGHPDVAGELTHEGTAAKQQANKEVAKGGGTVAVGTAGTVLPHWALWLVGAVIVLMAIVFLYRWHINQQRAAAYAAVAKEA